jgi:hypothetical protein
MPSPSMNIISHWTMFHHFHVHHSITFPSILNYIPFL